MNTSTKGLKSDAQKLLQDEGWKGPLAIGIVALVLAMVLGSILFDALKALIIIVLYIVGICLLGLAAYRAYQQSQSKK